MIILGISFGFHDASAALIVDGVFVAGAAEEMFSRKKHDKGFPKSAIAYCLQTYNLSAHDVDAIVYYENPSLKLDRLLSSCIQNQEVALFSTTIQRWMADGLWDVKAFLATTLHVDEAKIHMVDHHLSHASAAFFPSGFERAAVLTLDGVGEYETSAIYVGENHTLTKLESIALPHSIGLWYSAFTAFLGFEVNEGEYKVMGMAPYGKAIYSDKIKQTLGCCDAERFEINETYFNFLTPKDSLFTDQLVSLLGKPRNPEAPFFLTPSLKHQTQHEALQNQYYADIAASVQSIIEEVVVSRAAKAMRLTGSKSLCMGGGVALNSVANNKIRAILKPERFFIQPASGDGGSSLGAALYYYHSISQTAKQWSMHSALMGKSYTHNEIEEAIATNSIEKVVKYDTTESLTQWCAQMLVSKKVLGVFNGSFEWGPRALGARSIIASPAFEEMKHIVNEKIKFRELFRPFAPSVLAEYAHEWFEIDPDLPMGSPEDFMLSVVKVRPEKKELIPAITHVDGTARIQLVRREVNPFYYDLIFEFYKITGIPLVLNTSFNLRGEPIVSSPKTALTTFGFSEMDYLVMPPYVVHSQWNAHEG